MNEKVDEVVGDVKKLEKDTVALAREAQEAAEEKLQEVGAKCAELFQSALAAACKMPTVATERTKEVATTTNDYVQQNPWRAVAISAGVGLVLGVLFSRR